MSLLRAEGLEKWYGPRKVVDGVSYTVNAGEVVGLLGSNGAGKTTSFRMTTGQVTPNGGRVLFDGEDVTALPMFRRARLGMGYLSQEQSIFKKLTVEQNLIAILEALPRSRTLGRKLTRAERWERTEEALARFNLTQVRHNPAGRCSGGEKRRLEIARCLVCEPLLILLDEPFAAVDPKTTEDIRQNIRELAEQGIGILLTDHNVREVLKITDRSYLIQAGKVVTQGTPAELIRDPIAIREYLGNTFVEDGFGGSIPGGRGAVAAPPSARPTLQSSPMVLDLEPDDPAGEPIIALAPEPPPPTPSTPPPPRTAFGGSTQQLLEQEKMRRLVNQLKDETTRPAALRELSARGPAAVTVLLEALEMREMEVRHLAHRLLESVSGQNLKFEADATAEVRLRQIAHLRAKLEKR